MSLNRVEVTPIEQNRSLLNSVFKFKPTSLLSSYINKKGRIDKKCYTLAEILTILKDVIRGEGLYDEKNPSIIMCSGELETALNMKALHVTEIRDLVLSQLDRVQDDAFLNKFRNRMSNCQSNELPVSHSPVTAPVQRLIRTANISTHIVTDKNARFTVKPLFLIVLRLVPNSDQKKTIFTYEEVTLLLSTYILTNKTRFFDPRNIKLAIVKGDPLGDAFGVQAFHRCQVNNLLRSQLIPYEPDCPDRAVVTTTSTPGAGADISERPVPVVSSRGVAPTPDTLYGSAGDMVLPAFPALTRAQTLPGQYGHVRKREESESDNEDSKAKIARTLQTIRSPSDVDTETETLDSNQSRETLDIKEEEESDFEVNEYEPETGDEAERPPQAMGRMGVISDFSDSDSEVDTGFEIINKSEVEKESAEQKKESVYWGDSEEVKELDSYDSELETADMWPCATCNKPNKPYIRYCAACWQVRKGWLDYDRKKKRKTDKVTSHDSDTETDGAGADTGDTGDTPDQVADDRPRMDSQDSGIGSGESQEMEISVSNRPDLLRSMSVKSTASTPESVSSQPSSLDSGYQSTSKSQNNKLNTSQLCLLCCTRTKDASLVHGRIGHQVCCYPCAKKLWRKRSDCPVCRRKVERIIKIIPA